MFRYMHVSNTFQVNRFFHGVHGVHAPAQRQGFRAGRLRTPSADLIPELSLELFPYKKCSGSENPL